MIFGANGQDGSYLSAILQQNNMEPIAVSRSGAGITADVADYDLVKDIIKEYQPAFIFHFAANSTTRHDALFENHRSICMGALNILESARLFSPGSKIFISGSALQFLNEGRPIDEATPFDPSSAYATARIQSVYAARYFRNRFSLQVYVGYFFNHDSPLRTEQHVNQKIAMAVQRIAGGSNEKLLLGNMDVQKEFNYAGDIVEAVWQLVNQENIQEAVIGSGKAYSIKDWVSCCFEKKGLDWNKYVVTEQGFVPEYKILVSNPKLIMSLGWQPKVDLHQLADMMINA